MGSIALHINIGLQCLHVLQAGQRLSEYPISTAANGAGEQEGSGCTPRGRHHVAEKFGDGAAAGAVFVGRQATGEIYSAQLAADFPERDWILSRILWLQGEEPGVNSGGQCDTKARYIYIHGCPDTEPMGVARSHGCIRMRNADVMALYDQVAIGTTVTIAEQ